MTTAYYFTHPQVIVDPNTPIRKWRLSDKGKERAKLMRDAPWLKTISRIITSDEMKAMETADIIAEGKKIPVEVRKNFHEVDRSSTGFLHLDDFERTIDSFYKNPETRIRGWERAIDAQQRIVKSTFDAVKEIDGRVPILFIGHGTVGSLLLCHLKKTPISREQECPKGGGGLFAFSMMSDRIVFSWRTVERALGLEEVA